jgi:heme exporter protein D
MEIWIALGVTVLAFGGMYVAGVVEARRMLRRNGQWVEPPPRAQLVRRRSEHVGQ